MPLLVGGLAVAIWGTTPAATAFVARDIPPAFVGVARLLVSALALTPLFLIAPPRFPTSRTARLALLASGVVGFAASFVLQGLGVARTTTAHAALIFAAAPVATGILQFLLSRRWPRAGWWAGCSVSLAGVVVLILGREPGGAATATLAGDLILVAATLTVSVGYVAGARLAGETGLFGAIVWSILVGALAVLPAAPFVVPSLAGLTTTGWAALVTLAVLCTVAGYAAWFWALDRGGAARIAPIQFAQPLTSLLIAAFVLGETLSWTLALAMALVLGGVQLSRRNAVAVGDQSRSPPSGRS
ncbi:MAG: DMT family transporter [Hyphomicrobiales bacterium]|nr:DMT family transporter [Hyphomicrobiales bacterium]